MADLYYNKPNKRTLKLNSQTFPETQGSPYFEPTLIKRDAYILDLMSRLDRKLSHYASGWTAESHMRQPT